MQNAIIQYVLSARHRELGFTIEEIDVDIVSLCCKGKRVWTTSPFDFACRFSIEADKYILEEGLV